MAFHSLTPERFPAQRHHPSARPPGPLSTRAAAVADSNFQRNPQSASLSVPGLVWSVALVLVSCLVFKFPLTTTSGSVVLFRLLSSAASRNSGVAISNQANTRPRLPTSKGDCLETPLPPPATLHGPLVQRPGHIRVNRSNRKAKKPRADTSAPPKATFSPASYQLLRAYHSGLIGARKSPRRCPCCPVLTRNEGPSQVIQRLDPQMFWAVWTADRGEGAQGVGGSRSPSLGGPIPGPGGAGAAATSWFQTWATTKSFPSAGELFRDAQEAVKVAPSLSDVGLCVESALLNPRKEVTENEHMDLDSEELVPGSNAYLYHYMAQQRTAKRISQLARTGMLRARNGFEYKLLVDPFPGRMVSNPDYIPPPPHGEVCDGDLPDLLENDVRAEIEELDNAPWRPIRPPTPRYPDEVDPPPPRRISTMRKRMFHVVDPIIPTKPSEYSPPSPTETYFARLEGRTFDPTTVIPPPRPVPPFVPLGDFKYLFAPTLRVYSEQFIRYLCHFRRPRSKRPVWSWSLVPLGRYSTGAREVSGRLPTLAELDEEEARDAQLSKASTTDHGELDVELETPRPSPDVELHCEGEATRGSEDGGAAEPIVVVEAVRAEEEAFESCCDDVPFAAWDIEVAITTESTASTPDAADTSIRNLDATCPPFSGPGPEDAALLEDLEPHALSTDFLAQSTPQATSCVQAEISSHAPDCLPTTSFDNDDPVFDLGITTLFSPLPEVSVEVHDSDFVSLIDLDDAAPVHGSRSDSCVEVFLSAEDGETGTSAEVAPVEVQPSAPCQEGVLLGPDSSVHIDADTGELSVGNGSDLVLYDDLLLSVPCLAAETPTGGPGLKCESEKGSEDLSAFDDEECDHLTDGGLSDAPSVFSQNIFYDDDNGVASPLSSYVCRKEGRPRPSRPLYLCDEIDSPIAPRGMTESLPSPRPNTLDDKDAIPPSPRVTRSRWAPAPYLLPPVHSNDQSEIPSSPQFTFNPLAEDDRSCSWAYNNDHTNAPRRYMGYGLHYSQSQELDGRRLDGNCIDSETSPRHETVYFHLPSRLRVGANTSIVGSLTGTGPHEGDTSGGIGFHGGRSASGARFRFHVVDVDVDVNLNLNVNEGEAGGSGDLGFTAGHQWGADGASGAFEVEDSELLGLGLGNSESGNAVSGLGMEEGGSGSAGGVNRKRRRGCRGGKRGKNRRARRNALSSSSSAALAGGGTGDEGDDEV